MPPSDSPPTPPSSVSPLSEEAIAELERYVLDDDDQPVCGRCHKSMLTRDEDEPTPICDHCAHEVIPSLLAEVRALRAMVPTRGESIVANYPGQEWRLRMANVIAERDAALRERDEARETLKEALAHKETNDRMFDVATEAARIACVQRDSALRRAEEAEAKLEEAHGVYAESGPLLTAALAQRDAAIKERDEAREMVKNWAKTGAEYQEERDQAREERDAYRAALEAFGAARAKIDPPPYDWACLRKGASTYWNEAAYREYKRAGSFVPAAITADMVKAVEDDHRALRVAEKAVEEIADSLASAALSAEVK